MYIYIYVAIMYHGRQEFLNLSFVFCGRPFIKKKGQTRIINFIDYLNCLLIIY